MAERWRNQNELIKGSTLLFFNLPWLLQIIRTSTIFQPQLTIFQLPREISPKKICQSINPGKPAKPAKSSSSPTWNCSSCNASATQEDVLTQASPVMTTLFVMLKLVRLLRLS